MRHLGDDELVLLHYGDEPSAEAAAHALECLECRARLRALGEELGAVEPPPEPPRPADYGARVWSRIEPRLDSKPALARVLRPFGARPWRPLTAVAALAAALVVAFLLGRQFPAPSPPISAEVRERILLVAVGHHLERSQMVLIELANAPPDAPLDVSAERASADELVSANRLYRQTAARSGERALAAVLEELERVLIEVAAGPEHLSPTDVTELQRRIEARGLLFKIRVVGSQVREREKATPPSTARTS
jgi:hypothetical protein